MSRITLARLRHMSRHEGRWRAKEALHRLGERIDARTQSAQWNRRHFLSLLTNSARDRCASEASGDDWVDVQRALAAHISERPARFVLDPSSALALRKRVLTRWPGVSHDATDRAERLLRGRYDFLGYRGVRCTSDGRIDWHMDPIHNRRAPRIFYADVPYLSPEIGDHKIIWELNRHQHWLQLGRAAWLSGDARYATAIVTQLDEWLLQNPPLIGINWASMLEVALRGISWTCALHFLLGQHRCGSWELEVGHSSWLIDMLVALDRQMTHVERHLSYYFSPNTHLTGEALALYVVGTALPELAASERWVRTGRSVLLAEIDNQILSDGGHVERSTHYQRYTLDFYLLATLTARRAGDEVTARRLANASSRLADFTLAIADSQGRLPLIGDDDGGMLWPITGRACNDVRDSLALAAVIMLAGSLSLREIVTNQAGYWWGVIPQWYIFLQPIGVVIYMVAGVAETNRAPFDFPEAEQELVAGYHTEYSSMSFAMFFLAEYINMVTVSALATSMYLGGWLGPFLPDWLGWIWFLAKVFAIHESADAALA